MFEIGYTFHCEPLGDTSMTTWRLFLLYGLGKYFEIIEHEKTERLSIQTPQELGVLALNNFTQ